MSSCGVVLYYLVKSNNPFLANFTILYPQETPANLWFSRDVNWEHWPEMRIDTAEAMKFR